MSEHGYRVITNRWPRVAFQVIVPALPGIVTYGRTLEEAREMAQDAISCHLQGLLKENETDLFPLTTCQLFGLRSHSPTPLNLCKGIFGGS
jgi:predicted RNase H-like HicB family nuclease